MSRGYGLRERMGFGVPGDTHGVDWSRSMLIPVRGGSRLLRVFARSNGTWVTVGRWSKRQVWELVEGKWHRLD